jgi:hypothetical protein
VRGQWPRTGGREEVDEEVAQPVAYAPCREFERSRLFSGSKCEEVFIDAPRAALRALGFWTIRFRNTWSSLTGAIWTGLVRGRGCSQARTGVPSTRIAHLTYMPCSQRLWR